jgi:hypothetical protein
MSTTTLQRLLQVFLSVLCLTALWSVWISVHRDYAFTWLIWFCIGYGLLLVLRRTRDCRVLELVMLLSAAVSIAYLVNRDWWMREGWIAAATPMYRWLATLHVPVDLIRTHSADGAMLALVPLQIAAVRARRSAGRVAWPWGVTTAFSLLMLVAGASKGTLMLLPVAIGAGLWGVGWLSTHTLRSLWMHRIHWFAAVLCLLAAVPFTRFVAVERPWLSTSLQFALDYWLTGVGAGNFPFAYSLYRAILPTPFLPDAQNLFLDVWLTHGIVGLLAFLGACAVAFGIGVRALSQERGVDSLWRIAALGSLTIIVIQGIFDDPYYEDGRMLPVLAVVLAIAARDAVSRAGQSMRFAAVKPRALFGAAVSQRVRPHLLLAFLLVPMSLAGIPAVRTAVLASAFANVGALLQTRIDLRVIGDAPSNDAARRAASSQMSLAMRFYRRALAIDSRNALAHLRLGQIALIRRDLVAARSHLQAAWTANPQGRAERLLLGEVLWRQGDAVGADALWRSVGQWERSIEARESQQP